MITPEEAVVLTANTNNEIAKKVDEILNNDIDSDIRTEASSGRNFAKYYFKTRGENVDPIVEKFYSTIARIIRCKLHDMGWNAELIYSMKNTYEIVGISIHW